MNNSGKKSAIWKNHIIGQVTSGLTQSEYCKAKNIKHSTFLYWKRRLVEPTNAGRFIELPFSASNILNAKPRIHFRMINDHRLIIEIENAANGQFCLKVVKTLFCTILLWQFKSFSRRILDYTINPINYKPVRKYSKQRKKPRKS